MERTNGSNLRWRKKASPKTQGEDVITEMGSLVEKNNAEASNSTAPPPKKEEIIAHKSTPSIEDIITEDGILSSILSSLALREAVGTSVLSSRWRYLWTHLPKLVFGPVNMFDPDTVDLMYDNDTDLTKKEQAELIVGMTDHFITSVNSALHQLQGHCSRVDEFVVRYFLRKVHSHHLDEWVRFAVSKKTKVLALHLDAPSCLGFYGKKYKFPCHMLRSSFALEELILTSCLLRPPCNFDGLSHLKTLTLSSIDVTEEDITRLLSNCHTLQYLRLNRIPRLVTLTIPHPLDQFQTFVAEECSQLKGKININAVALRNLGYYGPPVDFVLPQSSQLLQASFTFLTEAREPNLEFYLNKISHNLPQLQILSCTISGEYKVPDFRLGSSSFIHLRRLDWCWNVHVKKMSLLHLATLLDAAPFLEELNLRLWPPCRSEGVPKSLKKLREAIPKHPHTHLKKLQIMHFFWDKWHVELTLYLLKNAIALETFKIMNGEMGLDEATAKKLRQELPASETFKIINGETGLNEATAKKLRQELPARAKLLIVLETFKTVKGERGLDEATAKKLSPRPKLLVGLTFNIS